MRFAGRTESVVGRRVVAVAVVVALFSSAGCGADTASLDRSEVEAVSIDNDNAKIALESAIGRVAQVCMEGRGFTVHPPAVSAEPVEMEVLLRNDVHTDPEVAGEVEDWYGLWFGTLVVTDDSEFSTLSQEDQAAYFAALYRDGDSTDGGSDAEEITVPGVGTVERAAGGCQRAAEDAVIDNYVDYASLGGLAGAVGGTNWREDSRVVTAREEWSSCMDEAGYDFEEPVDVSLAISLEIAMIEGPADFSDPDERAAAEVELAGFVEPLGEADHACHGRADLERVQSDVYWEYMTKHVGAHQEEFFSFRERVDEYLAVAQEIIDRGTL